MTSVVFVVALFLMAALLDRRSVRVRRHRERRAEVLAERYERLPLDVAWDQHRREALAACAQVVVHRYERRVAELVQDSRQAWIQVVAD